MDAIVSTEELGPSSEKPVAEAQDAADEPTTDPASTAPNEDDNQHMTGLPMIIVITGLGLALFISALVRHSPALSSPRVIVFPSC
jgi:hypothetical protein